MRRLLAVLACLFLLGCQEKDQTYGLVNVTRASLAVQPIKSHPSLEAYAQAWAEHLASRQTLAHSNLSVLLGEFTAVGEIVGLGDDPADVWRGFMGSSDHRKIVIDGRYRYAGSGAARSDALYVVVVFAR